jgi:hypothetical protein
VRDDANDGAGDGASDIEAPRPRPKPRRRGTNTNENSRRRLGQLFTVDAADPDCAPAPSAPDHFPGVPRPELIVSTPAQPTADPAAQLGPTGRPRPGPGPPQPR